MQYNKVIYNRKTTTYYYVCTTCLQAAYIIKAFEFLREGIFEEHRIGPKLDRFQRHSTERLCKSIDALRPFDHVPQIG